ncbi:MAG: NAD(+)/NADH kinase [Armatimonadetes bacterium]|nr:NAD(+)/NADH kinase [Armatimonadota bacterium]
MVAAAGQPAALEAGCRAVEALTRHGLRVLVEPHTAELLECPALSAEQLYHDSDVVVVFGGDGLVISALRAAAGSDTPVVGVNFGTFGFLAEIPAEAVDEGLDALAAGRYEIERRLMVEAAVGGGEWHPAANDVAVKAADPAHTLELCVHADGELIAEFPADGLVVATPTGSTAYSLSAGGPVVTPEVPAILLTPLLPHTLATRPLVLSAATEITVELVGPHSQAVVSVDGKVNLPMHAGASLVVRRSASEMLLARFRKSAFFDSLRGKLRWGKPK